MNQFCRTFIFKHFFNNGIIGLILFLAATLPMNLSAASGTVTFTTAPGGSTAHDGTGGSADISGIDLELYFADQNRTLIDNPLTFEDPYGAGTADSGLVINYLSSAGSHYVIIKSTDAAQNFWFQSLQISDYGGNDIKIEAFDNGVSQGSVNVAVNHDPWYFTFDQTTLTPSIFDNADEIRINGQDGNVIWLAINDIKIADAVVPNTPPTDIALSKTSVNQSAGVNATVGTLSSTDADSSSFTYSLVSGTGSDDNSEFNISGSTLRANDASTLAAGNYSVRIQTDDGAGGTFSKAFSITVVDDVAPSAPTSFSANAAENSVSLTWQNPANDFASVTIRRSSTSYPATIIDGTLVAQGLVGTSRTDDELADGTYYYSIFALDGAGNVSVAANASATVDTTAPTVSISNPSSNLTRTGPVSFTVTWSDAALDSSSINLKPSQVTVNTIGSVAVNSVSISGSGNTRTVELNGISGDGTVGISISANTASDSAGNPAEAAGPSATFTVDNTAPTLSIGAPSVSTTASGPVDYTITYTGADAITLSSEDVTLNKTGTANGTVTVTGTGNSSRTVTISDITGSGSLGISIAANTASDSAGNSSAATGASATFIVNALPIAGADSIARRNDTKLAKITKATLLANDTDADGDPLTITAVGNATPAGAKVVMAGSFVIYTSPATNSGDGSFTYTLSDGSGGHAVEATVPVIETASIPSGDGPNTVQIKTDGDDYTLTFIGVPEHTYRIQYTTSTSAPYTWNEFSPLAIFTAPTNGVFQYTDVNPSEPMRLYRAVPHP